MPVRRSDEAPPPPPPLRLPVPVLPPLATVTWNCSRLVVVKEPETKPAPPPAVPPQPPAPPPPHALTVSVRQPAGIVKVLTPALVTVCVPAVQTVQAPATHELVAPQAVPSATFMVVSVQTGAPDAQSIRPT